MLSIDEERFRESFETYSEIGATDAGGLDRLALTDEDRRARNRFVDDLNALGLEVRIDEIGNVFGRREGTDPDADPVLIGSHLDSQPSGGRFDGQLGVLSALEALRTLADQGIETERPIEIVNWTNEEGSRFQHAMLGSAVVTGETDLETALDMTDDDGVRLGDELERIGYDGDHPVDLGDVHGHVELHIEQGPKLAAHGNAVGVVEGVYGISWLDVTIRGESDHAGPTPMHARRDAMAAAADAVSAINGLPTRLSADAVATVGEFDLEPDSINVIPNQAEFSVDLRSADDDVVDRAVDRTKREIEAACDRHGTSADVEDVWRIPRTEFDASVCDVLASAAETVGVDYERLVSGAGHDAKYVSDIAPTAMLFVPSVEGRTHTESEYTAWEDCVAGANVYANAALALARD